MKTTDLITNLAKGAPEATVIMTATQLRGFAREIQKSCTTQPYATKPGIMREKMRLNLEKGEILRALAEAWPEVKMRQLAAALGVTRMWVYKLMKKAEEAASPSTILVREPKDETLADFLAGIDAEAANDIDTDTDTNTAATL